MQHQSTSLRGLLFIALIGIWATAATAQPQVKAVPLDFPVSSNNVIFATEDGAIVYGIVGLHVTEFLGVPVVGGQLWEKRTNKIYAFAAVQTANRRKWVWLTNGGPAGVVVVRPDSKVSWADNQEQSGCVVPL